MNDEHAETPGSSRRDFLRHAGIAVAALGAALGSDAVAQSNHSPASPPQPQSRLPTGSYNILFILTDQERYFRPGELPRDIGCPRMSGSRRKGSCSRTTASIRAYCTPSRSVLYTGRHIQHTKMFDNTNFPVDQQHVDRSARRSETCCVNLATTPPTRASGTSRRSSRRSTSLAPTKIFTAEMEAYGFSDYFGVGDIIAHNRGGYLHDGVIAAMGVSWLRGKGRDLAAQGKPWFLAVNLVNPHDIMFYDTDRPGPTCRPNILGHVPLRASRTIRSIRKQWAFELPASHEQPLDAPGRPAAHATPPLARCARRHDPATRTARWRDDTTIT